MREGHHSMKPCDPSAVAAFDYSTLHADFSTLSKPAQRALINNGITTPKQLARKRVAEVAAFHGVGPSALPVLRSVLTKHKLRFKGE